jgi:hypothetical protein
MYIPASVWLLELVMPGVGVCVNQVWGLELRGGRGVSFPPRSQAPTGSKFQSSDIWEWEGREVPLGLWPEHRGLEM